MTIREAKKLNLASGNPFFKKGNASFWDSKIESGLVEDSFFITSERTIDRKGRLYTIRKFNPDYTAIKNVGDFQAYATREAALAALCELTA